MIEIVINTLLSYQNKLFNCKQILLSTKIKISYRCKHFLRLLNSCNTLPSKFLEQFYSGWIVKLC